MSTTARCGLALSCLLLIVSSASADGEQQHDGLMLRFSPGHGLAHLSHYRGDATSATSESTQLGHGLAVDLGVAIADDCSILLRWSSLFASSSGHYVYIDLLSAGLTYYWVGPNLYATAAAGIALDGASNMGGVQDPDDDPLLRSSRSPDYSRVAAKPGFGLDLDLGKEFWVNDNWGVGPALRASMRQLDHTGRGGPWVTALLVVFSATYQ